MRVTCMILMMGGCHLALAQLQGDQWVMGYNRTGNTHEQFGIFTFDFREELPIYHIYPNISHWITGTSANVCDSAGEPLLHTNGMEILWMQDNDSMDSIAQGDYWDFNDLGPLPGGSGPVGFIWQEGATMVTDPTETGLYHLIYHSSKLHPVGAHIPNRILQATVELIDPQTPVVTEKDKVIAPVDKWYSNAIMSIRHANGRDWWLNLFEYDSAHYFSYLLDPTGVKRQFSGSLDIPVETGLGQFAFSWNGNYLVRVDANLVADPQIITICTFDRCEGSFQRIATLEMPSQVWPGIAVSPDERYVYASNLFTILQWDLHASDIAASVEVFDSSTTKKFGPMVTAPDGRIYCVPIDGNSRKTYVIDRPYLRADKHDTRQQLFPRENARSIPNNPNYRLGPIDGSPCDTLGIDNLPVAHWRYMSDPDNEQKVAFTDLSYYNPQNWLWDFGDGNTSDSIYPEHRYDAPGLYHVCLTVSNENASDSTCKWIEVDMSTSAEAPGPDSPKFTVAPNPFTDQIRISLGDDTQFAWHQLHIANMHGRIVVDQEVPVPSVIHLEHLPPGVYACVLYDENGSVIDSELAMKVE